MISLTNVLIFLYDCVFTFPTTDSFIGLINAPCVDGFDTKLDRLVTTELNTLTIGLFNAKVNLSLLT